MTPELEKLLIDWKVAGYKDCRAEWDAIVIYLNQQKKKKEITHTKIKAGNMVFDIWS